MPVVNLVDGLELRTILVFLAAFFGLLFLLRRKWNLPPGPTPWPFLGNMPTLLKSWSSIHVLFTELGREYGGIFSLRMGPRLAVVLTDYEIIKEAVVKEAEHFSERPNWMHFIKMVTEKRGIIWSNGQEWRNLRRFTVVALRDFGVGKKSLEQRIQEEIKYVLKEVAKLDGHPFSTTDLLQQAISNIICSINFGSRFEYTDMEFKKLMWMMNYNVSNLSFAEPVNFFPWLRFLPNAKIQRSVSNIQNIDKFVNEQIRDHRDTFDSHIIRDFVDLYLQKEEQSVDEDSKSFSRVNLRRTILDMFIAGTKTTSTTIQWFLLFLLRHQQVQKKCQDEIDKVIGSSRLPSLTDRTNMPYFMAALQETQRIGNTVPFAIPHSTKGNIKFRVYDIPERTIVFLNLYAVHTDPRYWQNPLQYDPERWLDNQGKLLKKEAFIPFSIGARACLGEILARMEIFLFMTTLLQRYTFKAPDGMDLPSEQGKIGITLSPEEFQLCAIPR